MGDSQAVAGAYASIPGWWSTPEWYAERVAEAPPVAHFVEVGSWQGRSACSAAEAIRDSGKLIRFDCVDTWQGTDPEADNGYHERLIADLAEPLRAVFERNLREAGVWRYINPVEGESVRMAETYADGSLDGVMIDAEHTAGAVEADLRAWLPKIRSGGWIGGHDAGNPGVLTALERVLPGGGWSTYRDCWLWRLPAVQARSPRILAYPPDWGSGDRWRPYIVEGFRRLGCELQAKEGLKTASHFLVGAHRGQPIHISALDVDGRRVWYDFSDFRQAYPQVCSLGERYYKVQAMLEDGSLPIGQGIGEVEAYFAHLQALREIAAEGPRLAGIGIFANTDKTGIRHSFVARLRALAEQAKLPFLAGLVRFNALRPEPPKELATKKLLPHDHWSKQAASALCYALPGVEGDWTWRHTEVLGIGRCLVTLATDQLLPGNWRGCWAEVGRDLGDLEDVSMRLLADYEERERLARLGRWYYESNLAPERMAARMAGCA